MPIKTKHTSGALAGAVILALSAGGAQAGGSIRFYEPPGSLSAEINADITNWGTPDDTTDQNEALLSSQAPNAEIDSDTDGSAPSVALRFGTEWNVVPRTAEEDVGMAIEGWLQVQQTGDFSAETEASLPDGRTIILRSEFEPDLSFGGGVGFPVLWRHWRVTPALTVMHHEIDGEIIRELRAPAANGQEQVLDQTTGDSQINDTSVGGELSLERVFRTNFGIVTAGVRAGYTSVGGESYLQTGVSLGVIWSSDNKHVESP